MKKAWVNIAGLTLCLCLNLSCRQGKKEETPLPPDTLLADGDLAFRRGAGVTSRIVLAADRNSEYSHVGILKRTEEGWCVIHAVPGEPDFKGEPDRVKVEPVRQFFADDRALCGMVMRWEDDTIRPRQAAAAALEVARRGTPFDHDYNLDDTTAMYCTELVEFAYRKAGIDLAEGRTTLLTLPVWGGTYILPSDLAANKRLKVLWKMEK